MNIIKTIFSGGLNLMRYFWHLIAVVFSAEKQLVMATIVPQVHQIAVDIQNKQPGLAALDFIKAVFSQVIIQLPGIESQLEHTAIVTVIATVSHDLNISNETGNAGNLSGGQTAGS